MIGAAALFVALLAYLRWHAQINHALGTAIAWLYRLLRDPKTFKVAETFCNEVAVLWFVFPLLDEIYEHWKDAGNASNHPELPSLKIAFSVAGLFFTFAIVLSHVGGGKTED
jgi:hypothetical protein